MSDEHKTTDGSKPNVDSNPNPYASPPETAPLESKGPLLQNTGIVARMIFGLWAGVLFGGTFGAGGSVMLGVTSGAMLGWHNVGPGIHSPQEFILTEIIAAIAGAIVGLFAGGLTGPIVSVISCLPNGKSRSVIWSAVILSTISGSAVGLIGYQVMTRASGADWRAAALGVAIGSLSGMLGGIQLGRGIISFANGEIS